MTATSGLSVPASSMLHRMTAIMDTFDSRLRRRSLQDVSTLSGLPRSTAHRILEQLVALGWVERTAHGYSLGWRAHHFSDRISESALLRQAAAPFMHDLAGCTRRVVHLAVLDGPFVCYLEKVSAPDAAAIPSRVGGFLPAHRTAVGMAMLAYVEPEALEIVLDRPDLCRRGEPVDMPTIYRQLATIRERGGLASESYGPFTCVGAPILGDGQVVGGLSLCDRGSAGSLDRFGPVLLERAIRVSAQLAL